MVGLQAVTITSAFVFGMVLALLGSIKLALAKRLGIDEARVGGLLAAISLALIPMMLLSGVLIDHWGPRVMLIVGSCLTGVGVVGLTVKPSYAWTLAALLLIGAAGACLSTASTVLMPKAFFPGHPSAALNLGNVFFGLGALLTPALVDLLLRILEFRRTMILLAVVCLIPALIAAATDREYLQVDVQEGDLIKVLSDWRIWLAGAVFLLYMPLEGSVGTWATTYLTDLGYGTRQAAWLLSGFWLTFLAGRLLMALLQQQLFDPRVEPWIILILSLLAAVVLGDLAGASSRGNAGLGLLALGLIFGPIFPTLVGIVFGLFPHDQGTAYGAMFAIGATGSLFAPPLFGAYARRTSVQHALRLPMFMALLMVVLSLVLAAVAQPR